MTTISKIAEKLRDPEYRSAYVASQINVGIPFQLRALLKSRGKTQEWLAEKTGMLQPRISGLMTPGKTRPNIETLRRLANAFDCGLAVRFVPFSELARWSENFDPEEFRVPSFEEEEAVGFIERRTAQSDISVSGGGTTTIRTGTMPSIRYLTEKTKIASGSNAATVVLVRHRLKTETIEPLVYERAKSITAQQSA